MARKSLGNVPPNPLGNKDGSSSCSSTQSNNAFVYSWADSFSGVFTRTPSAQRYSYWGPADITGHRTSVHNVPSNTEYKTLRELKKKTVFTATHSFVSSPLGNLTACSIVPLPSVCSICCLSVRPCARWWRKGTVNASVPINHGV